jgi:hypothetical protein
VEAGFFDSVFAGALVVVLGALVVVLGVLVLLLVSAFLDSDLGAVVLLELPVPLSPDERESVR